MGAIGGMLGLGGGVGGTGMQGPQAANISNPVTADQISAANTGTTNSLQQQQQLLQALQGQGGLQNQSQVYNQLQGVANGTGPNPAQAMLNQATGQNVANQAALMAGQRGAGANVGLLARQAAQTGAGVQQAAVGQGATMQANQSLNAINAAGNMANTQAANQIGQTNAANQAQQAYQNSLLGAQASYNQAQVGSQSSMNQANASLAGNIMGAQQGMIGGVMNGIGAALGATGGDVQKMAAGGSPDLTSQINPQGSAFGPSSKFGSFLKGALNSNSVPTDDSGYAAPKTQQQQLQAGASSATQGLINALSPAQSAPSPQVVAGGPMDTGLPQQMSTPMQAPTMVAAQGGDVHDYRSGGKVQAKKAVEKAEKAGNSYANDKIPAVLSEHEIVLPRSVTMSHDPIGASAKFVAATLAKRKMGR